MTRRNHLMNLTMPFLLFRGGQHLHAELPEDLPPSRHQGTAIMSRKEPAAAGPFVTGVYQPLATTGPLPMGALPMGALPIGALPTTGTGGGG